MDSHQHEALNRMFIAKRLCPWVIEHDLFIRGEIAKLEVTEPKDAANYKAFYQKRMDDYVKEKLPEPATEVPENTSGVTMADLQAVIDKKEAALQESAHLTPDEQTSTKEEVVTEITKPKKSHKKKVHSPETPSVPL